MNKITLLNKSDAFPIAFKDITVGQAFTLTHFKDATCFLIKIDEQRKVLESSLVQNVLVPCKGAIIDMPTHIPTEGVHKIPTNLIKHEYDGNRLMGFSCDVCIEKQQTDRLKYNK